MRDLDRELRARGSGLIVLKGDAVTCLRSLDPAQIYSHQETGNGVSYARDLAVKAWCQAERIEWKEFPTNGVIRRLRSRDGWAKRWEARMAEPVAEVPNHIPGEIPAQARLSRSEHPYQHGGEAAAQGVLDDFLDRRAKWYSGGISSPNRAVDACSRLSPFLTFGNLSTRQVVHATRQRLRDLDPAAPDTAQWRRSLRGFDERLHWRCHFIQKLESEPEIEDLPFVRSYVGLRESDWDEARYQALCEGRTGYPMVDACIRSMVATGWLNFRMRAMIASFSAYHLWLHWKPTALFAARGWTDYEPGIHYSQFQMQSGTTGINTLRIYNPTKQALDHDPEGHFIRQWIPELEGVPTSWIHAPWEMPSEVQASLGIRIGKNYPAPIVDHLESIRQAKTKIADFRRRDPEYRAQVKSVGERHGSRKSGMRQTGSRPKGQSLQASLFAE